MEDAYTINSNGEIVHTHTYDIINNRWIKQKNNNMTGLLFGTKINYSKYYHDVKDKCEICDINNPSMFHIFFEILLDELKTCNNSELAQKILKSDILDLNKNKSCFTYNLLKRLVNITTDVEILRRFIRFEIENNDYKQIVRYVMRCIMCLDSKLHNFDHYLKVLKLLLEEGIDIVWNYNHDNIDSIAHCYYNFFDTHIWMYESHISFKVPCSSLYYIASCDTYNLSCKEVCIEYLKDLRIEIDKCTKINSNTVGKIITNYLIYMSDYKPFIIKKEKVNYNKISDKLEEESFRSVFDIKDYKLPIQNLIDVRMGILDPGPSRFDIETALKN